MIRDRITYNLKVTGEVVLLTKDCIRCIFSRPLYYDRILEQMIKIGNESFGITVIIGVVTGLLMTLQFGHGLGKFGGTLYVPAIVSLSLLRELAPIFTSLIFAGRIGSSISAEIGAMNVTQQIDAIRALGTSPVRVLVVPRVIASIISLPLLAILAAVMGIFGGLIIAQIEFGMATGFYVNKVLNTIKFADVFGTMFKCAIFGYVVSILGCYRGFQTKEGTRGVGEATTWAVVRASTIILISDFFLSKVLILLFD
jgi:phospholipid/cholesterol/gamma-HCH transport system permease protein